MSSTPEVSVIIPSYNAAKYIGATLASVIHQSAAITEVIVVDDSSTDNTEAVVKDFSRTVPNISFIKLPHSGRPAISRNYGVTIARGNFIAFLDSDDLWMPDKIERQLSLLLANPEASFCYTMSITFGHNSIFSPEFEVLPLLHKVSLTGKELIEKGNSVTCSSVLARKEHFLAIGGFDENLTYHEDHDLWIRLAEKGKVLFIPRLLVKYRVHPGQHSGNFDDKKNRLEYFRKEKGYNVSQYTFARNKGFLIRILRNLVHAATAVYITIAGWFD